MNQIKGRKCNIYIRQLLDLREEELEELRERLSSLHDEYNTLQESGHKAISKALKDAAENSDSIEEDS